MDYKVSYQIIGVSRKAGEKENKRACPELTMKYDPDHNPNNSQLEERFKDINQAFQVLGEALYERRYGTSIDPYSILVRNQSTNRVSNQWAWVPVQPKRSEGQFRKTKLDNFHGGHKINGFSAFSRLVFAGIASRPKEKHASATKPSSGEKRLKHQVVPGMKEAHAGELRKHDVEV